jgi:SAM-dependent methyltransferase
VPEQNIQYFGRDLEAMSFAHNYHQWILTEFAPYLRDTVAEVGAGTGSFSNLLLRTSITKLFAYEPSTNMFPVLRESLSREPRATAINGFFGSDPSASFDAVLYVNVLEHIETDQAELRSAFNQLKPNGHLLIFVPALAWLLSDFDRKLGHYRRYTRPGLEDLVRSAGFVVQKSRYFDVAGIIPWYVNFVLLRNEMNAGAVALYDRAVVPIMRLVERLIPMPLGKNILLVARKP